MIGEVVVFIAVLLLVLDEVINQSGAFCRVIIKKELLLDLDDYYSGIFKQITFKNEEICILSDENIKDILEYQVNLIYEDCYTLPFMQEIEFSILLQSSKIIITKNKNEYIIKIK